MNNTTETAAIKFGSTIKEGDTNFRLIAIATGSRDLLQILALDGEYQSVIVVGHGLRGEYDSDLWAQSVNTLSERMGKPVVARQVADSELISLGLDDKPIAYGVPLLQFDIGQDDRGRSVLQIQPIRFTEGNIAEEFFGNVRG